MRFDSFPCKFTCLVKEKVLLDYIVDPYNAENEALLFAEILCLIQIGENQKVQLNTAVSHTRVVSEWDNKMHRHLCNIVIMVKCSAKHEVGMIHEEICISASLLIQLNK